MTDDTGGRPGLADDEDPSGADTPIGHDDRPSTIPWPPLLLLAVAIAALLLGRLVPLPWPGMDDTPARVIGIGFGVLGVALMGWAFWEFFRARTNILPHRAADHLITSGPFRRFRNPIYLADTMLLLCAAELTKNIWFVVAAACFVPLVTWLAILPEERHLARRFGDAYRDYVSRSRRWI
ncbi:MAG: isoprenylcysteine carboxylmethyltransferase family protein [Pseudomonadota bacterium]